MTVIFLKDYERRCSLCRATYVFTDIFTSPRAKTHGSKPLSFRNPQPHGMTGTQEFPQNVTVAMPHHVFSTNRVISARYAITIHVSVST